MNKRLAIVGAHPRTRDDVDWDDKTLDIWAFNEALSVAPEKRWIKRCDLIFQLHLPAIWRNPLNRNDPAHLNWLHANPPPTLKDVGVTEIRLAMPPEYKRPNPVEAYRTYYRENKLLLRKIVVYSKRGPPPFLAMSIA